MKKRTDDEKCMLIATIVFYILLGAIVVALIIVNSIDANAVEEPEGAFYLCGNHVKEKAEIAGPPSVIAARPKIARTCAVAIPRETMDISGEVLVKRISPGIEYYDIPLENALQSHVIALCEEYGIDPTIIFAMIKKESMFQSDAIGDSGNSFGLMQIQQRYHQARMDKLGCDDLLDPYQNVEVGIDLLAELIDMDRGLTWALMCYNGGYSYANKKVANGEVSYYAQSVLDTSEALKRGT